MEAKKQQLLRSVFANPEKHTKAIQAFKDAYQGLSIGNYSDDVFNEVIANGPSNISERFKNAASEQLDKSGVKSPLLKSTLLNGCDEVLAYFNNTIDGMIQSAEKANEKEIFDKISAKQMKFKYMGLNYNYIGFVNQAAKRLEIGINATVGTECGKDYELMPCRIDIFPAVDTTYHIYAKVNRISNKASLVALKDPQENTEENFFILWQSGSFDEIKIPVR